MLNYCLLSYVELLFIFYYQVVDYDQMPSIQDWRMSEYPLCSVSVDNTKVIEDAGTRTLQVCISHELC